MELPSGTVTFLFTDIEESTKLWEKHPEAMKTVLAKHDVILRQAIQHHHGQIIKGRGDGVHAVFTAAIDGIMASVTAQQEFQKLNADRGSQPDSESENYHLPEGIPLRVRMGLHTGEAEIRDGDYFGQAPNRAARVMSVGYGGQILLSEVTARVASEHLPEGTTLLDLGEHPLKGLLRPERIYQITASGIQENFPALKTSSTARNNLPAQLTPFIGRRQALDEAQSRLSAARLLTLIGPGGIGKTRLSVQIAAEQLELFGAGAWLVELAPVTDPGLTTAAIAQVFDLREASGIPLIDLVIDYLRDRELLLILDNCEHLVEACAQIADRLLQACPKLKLIASSREALGIQGESVYRVPPLSAPQEKWESNLISQPGNDLDSLLGYEAPQLFVERAARAEPRFKASAANISAIIQICQRLDGIPLAIELAAARVKLFTPEQIAERLDNRFKLLTGGSRTALPRQQTLQALIDWSYQLLNKDEQRTLRHLAVFSGGWTYEAVESVIGEVEALECLPELIAKSLVIVDDQNNRSRYYFLETIRQYAMEKLVESGEAVVVRDRHLDYVLNLMSQSKQSIYENIDPDSLERTEVEHDNLRAALAWATANHPEKAVKLANAVGGFWALHDYNSEAREWCKSILNKTETLPGLVEARARLTIIFAWLSIQIGEHKDGRAAAEKVLAMNTADTQAVAYAYCVLALALFFLGENPAAQQVIQDGENLARSWGHKFELAMILSARGQMAFYTEDDATIARQYLEESVQLAQETGYLMASSLSTFGLSLIAIKQGDLEVARARLDESNELSKRVGNLRIVYTNQSEFAHLLRKHGELDQALALYKDLLPKWKHIGHRAAVTHELECIAYILIRKDDLERAATLLGAAEALREAIDSAMTAPEKDEYNQEKHKLKMGMGERLFAQNWRAGREMTLDLAIAYALGNSS